MGTILFGLAIFTLLAHVLIFLDFEVGGRSIGSLREVAPSAGAAMPKVSVIIAARNEERNVREALQSLLDQDYSNLGIVIVNDRSTDRTGAILDELQSVRIANPAVGGPQLKVVHIQELPPGWLGKNHALYVGVQQASGELLLFTDADVVMDPSTISRAVGYLMENKLDHLTVTPNVRLTSVPLGICVGTFMVYFMLYARPWKARDPKSKRHIGIGAFNLVRREAYHAAGTHQAIALRPDDDMKLGKLIKMAGYRQDVLHGVGLVEVEWYSSVRGLIHGLMKNTFAGVEYSVAAVVGAAIAQIALLLWPFAALGWTAGTTWLLNLASVLVMLLLYCRTTRPAGIPAWYALGFPPAVLLMIYIQWRAMLLTLLNQGIIWRDTHYPLAELKANKV